MTEITNKIYYVGVNDRNKHRLRASGLCLTE